MVVQRKWNKGLARLHSGAGKIQYSQRHHSVQLLIARTEWNIQSFEALEYSSTRETLKPLELLGVPPREEHSKSKSFVLNLLITMITASASSCLHRLQNDNINPSRALDCSCTNRLHIERLPFVFHWQSDSSDLHR